MTISVSCVRFPAVCRAGKLVCGRAGGSMFVCVFVSYAGGGREREWRVCPFKKNYVHINAVLVCLSLKDSFSCLDCTLVGAIMERAVVQITLLGLLLALVTTLPNKVRPKTAKRQRATLQGNRVCWIYVFISYCWLICTDSYNRYLLSSAQDFCTSAILPVATHWTLPLINIKKSRLKDLLALCLCVFESVLVMLWRHKSVHTVSAGGLNSLLGTKKQGPDNKNHYILGFILCKG